MGPEFHAVSVEDKPYLQYMSHEAASSLNCQTHRDLNSSSQIVSAFRKLNGKIFNSHPKHEITFVVKLYQGP
jgi:hypothetical protein